LGSIAAVVRCAVPKVFAVVAAHSPLAALLVRSHCGAKSPLASVQVREAVVAIRAIGFEIE